MTQLQIWYYSVIIFFYRELFDMLVFSRTNGDMFKQLSDEYMYMYNNTHKFTRALFVFSTILIISFAVPYYSIMYYKFRQYNYNFPEHLI